MPSLPLRRPDPSRTVRLAAIVFAVTTLALQWWRLQSLTASYDQGIFFQILWNGLHGHPFESTLSSQLSTNVIHAGEPPALGYHRLGQHFTPILVLWVPLVGLLGVWALPLVQVGVVTGAGLVLHRLAARRLEPPAACLIALSFYGANAVLGPTLGNFTDLVQLPLLVFLLLLGLESRSWPGILLPALLIPLVREDTGVVLAGIGLWLTLRVPRRRWLGLALMVWGLGWVLLVTNVLMPLFSEDNARRFMVENFGQYLGEKEKASSLQVLSQVLRQPLLLLRELISPPGETLRYLLGQGLPLMFVPYLALDTWLLMGLPLLGLLLAQGDNNPLSINIRYTFLVVPGLFAGAILWWQRHQPLFRSARRLRRVWAGCILLSLLFALTSNPNRSLSFLIPDSIDPWIHRNAVEQWSHGVAARSVLRQIPDGAPVAANTPLVPHLADRQVLVRFPRSIEYLDRRGRRQRVEWIAADLAWMRRYAPAFRRERGELEDSRELFEELRGDYGVRTFDDGVVLLQRGAADEPAGRQALEEYLGEPPPSGRR
jgi:uncharacterized membrane protein